MEEIFGKDKVFAFSRPKDIVSGDFYWVAQKGDLSILAVADCTGHGVPGAFMSMIGESLFNLIVHDREIHDVAMILEQLDAGVEQALKQQSTERKDGMEVSICVIDRLNQQLYFSAARNHAIAFTKEGILKMPATRRSIGGDPRPLSKRPSFINHSYPLGEIEGVCLYSDGFKDQFGGPKNKRLMSKPFYRLLEDVFPLSPVMQERKLGEALDQWMQDFPQTDDITVVGVKI